MFLGARAAVVLSVFGLAVDSISGVIAGPLVRSPGMARVLTSCTQNSLAALTFDDGPSDYAREAMKILEDNGARGTFFINGQNWGCIYDKADVVKEIVARGHQVGSHTWSHAHLPSLSASQIVQELTKTHLAIKEITGVDVAFMRPPYGEFNNEVRQVAASLGETLVTWNLDSGDSTGLNIDQQKAQYHQAVDNHMGSIISLQHDVHPTSVRDVLPYAIQTLQSAGYRLVTVAECVGEAPYSSVGQPQSRKVGAFALVCCGTADETIPLTVGLALLNIWTSTLD